LGIYNKFSYNDGTVYGDATKLPYSAEPFTATALGTTYATSVINGVSVSTPVPIVQLTWSYPTAPVTAPIKGIRVVRNQEGYSENEEDGKVILEQFGTQISKFTDSDLSSPITYGKHAYYTIWILYAQTTSPAAADVAWKLAGFTQVTIPKDHGVISPDGTQLATSTDKLMRLLPKVYTSGTGDSLGELDATTDLYKFLSAVAYTQDEITTNTDLLVKTFSGQEVNPNFVSPLAQQLGLPILPGLNMLTQKKLIRQAIRFYKNKGTLATIQEYTSTLTGYPTTTVVSPNILLSLQDSSFYKGVGSWTASGSGITLTSDTSGGPTAEPYALDNVYVGKAVSTLTTGYIALGETSPLFTALPVFPNDSLSISFYLKASVASSAQVSIDFYGYNNGLLHTLSLGSAFSVTTSWARTTYNFTVPTVNGSSVPISPYRAVVKVFLKTVATYYLDLAQVWYSSDTRGTSYHPARGVEIYLAPKKVNYLKNPSFANTNSWTVSGFTGTLDFTNVTDVPGIVDGSNTLRVPSANPSTFLMTSVSDVVPSGNYYTFSFYAKTSTGTMPTTISLSVVDAASSTEVDFMAVPTTATFTSTWVRYSTRMYISVYSGDVYLKAYVTGASSSATPLVDLYFDAAQLEQGYTATDFFSGDYTIRGAKWTSTTSNSVSISYPNKATKLTQLKGTLTSFLPLNTAYLITTGYGSSTVLEASGVSS
jgi:hypothetical protein